jgi:hypothetical protein
MTVNMVTVTIAASGSPVDAVPPEGNFVFSPNGNLWPLTPGSLPIIPDIQTGTLVSGTASCQLVASDNYAVVNGVNILTWDVIINIRGLPTVNFPGLVINFATGSSQSIWDILAANGWNATDQE